MVSVRPHPGDSSDSSRGCGGEGTRPGSRGANPRLNLLLSCAGWQPDPWVDRLPRLLEPMGIISHLADTGREASKVITAFPIHIAVVDLGLPLDTSSGEVEPEFEEGGPRLLELLSRLAEPPPVVAVKRARTQRGDSRDISDALRLGAFAVIDRPQGASDLDLMLHVLRRILERHYKGRWPDPT